MKHTLFSILAAFLMASCIQPRLTDKTSSYQFSELHKSDLNIIVSSTGTLAADGAVEVGSEISGTVGQVLVDFNDKVVKGKILARLKTDLLESSIREAEANVLRAKAQYDQAQTDFTQNQSLFEKAFVSEKEYLPIKTAFESAKASLQSAQASLDRARTNLGYAIIRSPIDGVILERNIEAGQTIAASFSSPTLFVIAKDLKKMKIEALVDETDISRIKINQSVRFSVSAYPDRLFDGKVIQVRRKPVSVQNVVNYTVIVDAPNADSLLLPGMTATIDFIIEQANNVFCVPNEALSIEPSKDMIRDVGTFKEPRAILDQSRMQLTSAKPERLWYLDEHNKLRVMMVTAGPSNETVTTVAGNSDLREGLRIITGISQKAVKTTTEKRPMGPPMF
jgi:HlyD family secretion protein